MESFRFSGDSVGVGNVITNMDNACEPIQVMPSQWWSTHHELVTEHKLAWKVLMQGVCDCLVVRAAWHGAQDTKEARQWALSDEVYVMSFRYLCEAFGIDHLSLRALLRRASSDSQLRARLVKFTGMKHVEHKPRAG